MYKALDDVYISMYQSYGRCSRACDKRASTVLKRMNQTDLIMGILFEKALLCVEFGRDIVKK